MTMTMTMTMTLARRAAALILLAGLGLAAPASAADPVLAIVEVPTPWYAPGFLVRSRMRETIPTYARLPGLAWKGFSIAEPSGDFGGIYLWRDAEAAAAWYSPAWHARVRESRGAEARLRVFAVVGLRDLAALPRDEHSDAMATLLVGTAPAHDAADPPGLLRQVALRDGDGRPARLDIWANAAAAEAYFDAGRRAALGLEGGPARLERFALPILLPSDLAANRLAGR